MKRRKELKVSDDLAEIEGITPEMLVVLGKSGIKTRDDLADLATDELLEITAGNLREDKVNEIIMAARAHWFEDEEPAPGEGEGEEEGAEEGTEEGEDPETAATPAGADAPPEEDEKPADD
jgi:N utilization substance protein A